MPSPGRRLRVIGFDDAPFERTDDRVQVAGVVCSGTRFEGMVWGEIERDGFDATDALATLLGRSKFHDQVRLVLLDGIAVGGLNVVDLPELAARLELPCVAVMRRMPDLAAMERVIARLPEAERRLAALAGAGPIHRRPPFVFQVAGIARDAAAEALARVTDTGAVPEALRLAHLIGSAVVLGESRGRA
jgi:hypothetical protein